MTGHSKILDKIKKCLALSKSSNQHEAAAALRQAHKLMKLHGIEMGEVAAAGVNEQIRPASAKSKPPKWEWMLASTVGRAFDCRVIMGWELLSGSAQWQFIGTSVKPELACYAYDALFVQLRSARANYMATTLKRCRKSKTRRADLYAEAFVNELYDLVASFAGKNEDEEAIAAYLSSRHPDLFKDEKLLTNRNAGNKKPSARDICDMLAGRIDGQNANLWHGVNGQEHRKLGVQS
ncbi:MAG: DUF2786 domain-containing protein [Zoogloeaceae bacterium]|jgi:hypothetical protein|nr:DUF2786 domain-containing protein [Zoogloeaceae bacterium]